MSAVFDRVRGALPGVSGVAVSEDVVYDALRFERRRWAVEEVAKGPVGISTLAENLTDEEVGGVWDYADRKARYVSLHQTHLPALEEAGLIDRDGLLTKPTPRLRELDRIRQLVENETGGENE